MVVTWASILAFRVGGGTVLEIFEINLMLEGENSESQGCKLFLTITISRLWHIAWMCACELTFQIYTTNCV